MEPWLVTQARRRPDRPAVNDLTYAQLLDRARAIEPAPVHLIAREERLETAVHLHACLLHGAVAVASEPVPAEVPPGTVLVVNTSGTTAAPKPVFITRENIEANALGSALALGLDPEERWLCPMPLTHVGGLMVLLRSVIYGTTAVLAGAADPVPDDVTLVSMVPTILQRHLAGGWRPGPRLRAILLGGAPIPPALLEDPGLPVRATYGLTEATSQVTVDGWPIHGVTVSLAEDSEIVVDGPTVATARPLHTGDLGAFDERGRLMVTGRKADTIISGGENVAPAEVEAVLTEHPAVADAAVYGRPHVEWGEAVTAAVVLRAPVEPAALQEFCRARLAPHKVPKTVEIVPSLPRTPSGKLLRRALVQAP